MAISMAPHENGGITNSTYPYGMGTVFRLLLPPAFIGQPLSQTNIAVEQSVFHVSATSLNPMNYQWQKDGISLSNGGNVFGAASSTLVITGVSDSDAASYSVIVTSETAVTKFQLTLTVIDPPVLSVQCVAGNLQVNFTGMVNRNYVIQYRTTLFNLCWLILVSVTNL